MTHTIYVKGRDALQKLKRELARLYFADLSEFDHVPISNTIKVELNFELKCIEFIGVKNDVEATKIKGAHEIEDWVKIADAQTTIAITEEPEEGKSSDRFNEGKPQWSMVHFASLEPLVRTLEYGAKKYSKDNWKGNPVGGPTQHLESLSRHLFALMDGEENDPESGLPHIGHIMANAMFYSYHTSVPNAVTPKTKNILTEQCKHPLSEVLKELKYSRPAEAQTLIEQFIEIAKENEGTTDC